MAAEARPKAPPITPVATTDRVSRYTQKVRANHRNELVTPLTNVFTSRRRNTARSWDEDGAAVGSSTAVMLVQTVRRLTNSSSVAHLGTPRSRPVGQFGPARRDR